MANGRPRSISCENCSKRVKVGPMGRIPMYCSNNCKQAAFIKSHRISADDRHRLLIWGVLQDAGLIPADRPLPRRPEAAT